MFFDGTGSPKETNKALLEDMMNSMDYDIFKDKEAYDKDEFYVKLCKGAKRA